MSQQEIDRQRHIVAAHIAAENAHDWKAVEATFAADDRPFFDVVPLSAHLEGVEGVANAYHLLSTALPDLELQITGAYDAHNCSIREVTMTGTHTGDYVGTPASGNKVTVEMACIFLFRHDAHGKTHLIAERVYYDNQTVLAQMHGDPKAGMGVGLAKRG